MVFLCKNDEEEKIKLKSEKKNLSDNEIRPSLNSPVYFWTTVWKYMDLEGIQPYPNVARLLLHACVLLILLLELKELSP